MKRKSPSEDRLIQELNSQNFSTKPTKRTPCNRQQVLEEIALKRSSRGFYKSPARAMIALLEGVQ